MAAASKQRKAKFAKGQVVAVRHRRFVHHECGQFFKITRTARGSEGELFVKIVGDFYAGTETPMYSAKLLRPLTRRERGATK